MHKYMEMLFLHIYLKFGHCSGRRFDSTVEFTTTFRKAEYNILI